MTVFWLWLPLPLEVALRRVGRSSVPCAVQHHVNLFHQTTVDLLAFTRPLTHSPATAQDYIPKEVLVDFMAKTGDQVAQAQVGGHFDGSGGAGAGDGHERCCGVLLLMPCASP